MRKLRRSVASSWIERRTNKDFRIYNVNRSQADVATFISAGTLLTQIFEFRLYESITQALHIFTEISPCIHDILVPARYVQVNFCKRFYSGFFKYPNVNTECCES